MKKCIKCGLEKELNEFGNKKRPNGKIDLVARCKLCIREANKIWGRQTKEEKLKKSQEWRSKNIEHVREKQKKYDENIPVVLFNCSKRRAKKKNIEHTITIEDIVVPTHCPIYGIPIKKNYNRVFDDSATLDRIDNTKGYTPDNIHVISYRANRMKSDASFQDIEMMYKWAILNKNKMNHSNGDII